MRLTLVCFFTFFTVLSAGAQPRADEYIDVVFLRGGSSVEGTLIAYEFGNEVTIVTENGGTKTYAWDEIRRVNFRLDKRRLADLREKLRREAQVSGAVPRDDPGEAVIDRKFLHQVTGSVNLGQNTAGFRGQPVTTIGGSAAYHLYRQTKWINLGLGVDVSMMSHLRRENVLALTGQFEYPLTRNAERITPFIRAEIGPAIPFGSPGEEEEITERNVTAVLHPSVGLYFAPREGNGGGVTVDLGYRFLDASFTITNSSLEVIERTVSYRRLCLRGGLRF